jgi:hypothetical protein
LIPRLTKPAQSGETRSPGGFSFMLYLQHREYNAGVGALLLYLTLILLRPLLAALFHLPR